MCIEKSFKIISGMLMTFLMVALMGTTTHAIASSLVSPIEPAVVDPSPIGGVVVLSTSGLVGIEGEVPSVLSVTTTDLSGVDFNNLGQTVVAPINVGEIEINSNGTAGFNVSLSAANKNNLTLVGSVAPGFGDSIGFDLSMEYVSGVLGHTEPAGLSSIILTTTPTSYSWTAPTEPATNLVYAVRAGIPTVKSLISGAYSATIEFDIASN